MNVIAVEATEIRQIRGMFSTDELGWVGADAEAQAVLLGGRSRGLPEAHERIVSLGLVAGHPRLKGAVEEVRPGGARVRDTAFWRSWDGHSALLPEGDGVVAIVFLGWRGAVALGGTILRSEIGTIAILDRRDIAELRAVETTGPILAIGYAADGVSIPSLADNCLWPAAWCVAG